MEYDNDNYKIHVNVKDFRPEELVVKTVDNTVKVIMFIKKDITLPLIALPLSGSWSCVWKFFD